MTNSNTSVYRLALRCLRQKADQLTAKGWRVTIGRSEQKALLTARKGLRVKFIELRALEGAVVWRTHNGRTANTRTIV